MAICEGPIAATQVTHYRSELRLHLTTRREAPNLAAHSLHSTNRYPIFFRPEAIFYPIFLGLSPRNFVKFRTNGKIYRPYGRFSGGDTIYTIYRSFCNFLTEEDVFLQKSQIEILASKYLKYSKTIRWQFVSTDLTVDTLRKYNFIDHFVTSSR